MLFRNIIITYSYVLFSDVSLNETITRFNSEGQCSFKPLAVSSSLTRITGKTLSTLMGFFNLCLND